jgi:hypothetical protein
MLAICRPVPFGVWLWTSCQPGILDTQFEKYHAFKPTRMNLKAEISNLAVQKHDNLVDQNVFNLLGVFSCHSKRYRHEFTLPEDYLCRVQYRSAKVSSSGSGNAKIQDAAHILPSSIFFLNLLSRNNSNAQLKCIQFKHSNNDSNRPAAE